jgi:hypothetical protein
MHKYGALVLFLAFGRRIGFEALHRFSPGAASETGDHMLTITDTGFAYACYVSLKIRYTFREIAVRAQLRHRELR